MGNKEYRPTLSQLRTFVTIAENRHFGTAANKLHISQPSLSQALVALESGLGIQLIERSTRKVIVTPLGESLLPFAKATLEAADSFVAHSRGAHGRLSGPLTVGIIPTLATYILPDFLHLAREHYPDLEPRLVEEQTGHLMQQLRDGQIDIAVLATPTDTTGMIEYELFDEEFVVVTHDGHPFAGRRDLTLDVLKDLDLLLLDDGHCLRDQIVDLCRVVHAAQPASAESAARASSLTTIMQLVVAGLGSTLVPVSAIATECTRPGLSLATFDNSVIAQRTVGLVCRSSSTRAAEYETLGALVTRAFHMTVDRGRVLIGN
ncbi:putative hydrogen peroxide-inducible genes activator [Corynebacterium capitovis DSM 44611]|uniref:hydrogen peroxide-inducible genes activator n=1 Tax=Corynebacterium capitovis TaxID=131081 RepID=UPI00047580F2|nr:hydrogen peroxide-inducible genes activator [Corynebacterium capitovis]WKD57522.1 putative hydrogen peroxide-inducible genes activator [Corynebacterium capitovis DSM 44611]